MHVEQFWVPEMTMARPSGSAVTVGYHRAKAMRRPELHVLLVGSKIVVSRIPTSTST